MSFIFRCPYCRSRFEAQDDWEGKNAVCPSCSKKVIIERNEEGPSTPGQNIDLKNVKNQAEEKFRDVFNLEKLEGFSLSRFLRQLFKPHSWEETEDYLSFGTPSNTPKITEIEAVWPAPWLFFRTMLVTVGLCLLIIWRKDLLGDSGIMPYLITGVLGIPIATLLFFWEVNISKNVSIISLIRIMLISGFVSICVSWLIRIWISNPRNAIWAGPIEETAKALTILLFIRNKRYGFKLNGLLIGAAVGAGFEIFEDGGYVINTFLDEFSKIVVKNSNLISKVSVESVKDAFDAVRLIITADSMGAAKKTLLDRAITAPFSHIPWSALVGAALWRCKENKVFSFSNLASRKFLPLFLCAVGLHMFWNSPLLAGEDVIKTAIVAVVGFFIIIYLIQEGINEIRKAKVDLLSNGSHDSEENRDTK
ncbi:MAG: PrsW family intramembrane metalloprotease [Lentisphaeria bacterium]|nr:PrsW family intramembrane metalloprotease [Lentisphaeria bacterium]